MKRSAYLLTLGQMEARPRVVRTLIQEEGESPGTSLAITFSAPTSGNRLVLLAAIDKEATGITVNDVAMTLLEEAVDTVGTNGISGALWSKVSNGTETSFTVSWTGTLHAALALVEVQTAGAVGTSGQDITFRATADRSSGVITADAALATVPQLVLAFAMFDSASSTDGATSHGWSNGFVEIAQLGMASAVSDSGAPSVSIGQRTYFDIVTPETEFTYAGDTADEGIGFLVTIKKAA